MESGLVIFLVIVVIYTVVAVGLGRRSITMLMFFLAVGALIGANGVTYLNISLSSETVKLLVGITLALLLFADSSTLRLHQLKDDAGLPARLLGLALPLIILSGGVLAFVLFPQEGLGFALPIGAILAPTDAALGLAIFTNRRVPVRIRRALNVESGLKDGIAAPFVTLFTALAVAELTQKLTGWLRGSRCSLSLSLWQLGQCWHVRRLAICCCYAPPFDLPGNRADRNAGAGPGDLFQFDRIGWKWLYPCFRGRPVLQLRHPTPATPCRGIHRGRGYYTLAFRLDNIWLYPGHSSFYCLQSDGIALCCSESDFNPYASGGSFSILGRTSGATRSSSLAGWDHSAWHRSYSPSSPLTFSRRSLARIRRFLPSLAGRFC